MTSIEVEPAIHAVASCEAANEGCLSAPPRLCRIPEIGTVRGRRFLRIGGNGWYNGTCTQPNMIDVAVSAAKYVHQEVIGLSEQTEREGLALLIVTIHVKPKTQLLQVAEAIPPLGGRLGLGQSRQKHGRQNRDDGNDH